MNGGDRVVVSVGMAVGRGGNVMVGRAVRGLGKRVAIGRNGKIEKVGSWADGFGKGGKGRMKNVGTGKSRGSSELRRLGMAEGREPTAAPISLSRLGKIGAPVGMGMLLPMGWVMAGV